MAVTKIIQRRNARRSFTLIEILIASAIFTAIITLTIGAFSDSLVFQSSSTTLRITRQSAATFVEYLTRQLRQANTTSILISAGDVDLATNPGGADYNGTGYVIMNGFNGTKIKLPTFAGDFAGTALIFPLLQNGQVINWLYAGPNPTGASAQIGLYKGPVVAGNVSQIQNVTSWVFIGQVLPSEVVIKSVGFHGVNPQSLSFDLAGNITSFNTPAQPFVDISLQIAPKDSPNAPISYQTSLTSRDYKFAFPTCGAKGVSC